MSSRSTIAARRRARPVQAVALAGLLAIPLVVAFFSGGYFDRARLWALLATCLVLLVVAVVVRRPLPRTRPAILAVAGLWALAAWTAASIAWAPLRGPAFHDFQRLLLYALAFTTAVALMRERALARAVEPVIAGGLAVVLGYGLAGRLVPGVVPQSHGAAAAGRLDQPLTYWNAEGAVAAIALVICARLAGDGTRHPVLRAAAAAVSAIAGMAVYLSYSRGALGAAVVGLLVLLAALPDRRQLRALLVCAGLAIAGALVAAPFPVVASLDPGSRSQGVAALALLIVLAAVGAFATRLVALREAAGRLGSDQLRVPALRPLLAGAAIVVLAGFVVAAAASEHRSVAGNPVTGATATRLTSVQSHRYAYWKVAAGAFADHPLAGLGSGGFGVRWLERRKFVESVHDAHSLYIETAAELGLVGLLTLAVFVCGVVMSARTALRIDPLLAAGPVAAVAAWAFHAGVDWLWEMPTVSLVALMLAAAFVARVAHGPAEASEQPPQARRATAPPQSGSA